MASHKYHGKNCDFDFYVVSLNTDNTNREANAEHLALDEALQEIKRRDAYAPNHVVLALGVDYTITSNEHSDSTNCGALDLLHRKNGEYRVLDDIKTDKVLMDEALISVNSMQRVKEFVATEKEAANEKRIEDPER